MELPSLRAFVKVVQLGSFTRAAEALGSQKAHVSRVVSALERELGLRLLERSTRALSLTEAGREMYERAQAILAAVEDAERMAQQVQGDPRGTLRLTCGVEFGQLAVSAWIDEYLVRHPQVRVEAEYTARVVDLVHEGFDLAIRVGSLPDSSLAARSVGRLEYVLVAAPSYLRQHGAPRSPDALRSHELLIFSAGASAAGWRFSRGGDEVRVAGTARLRVNNSFAVRDAALRGLGIAALPRWLAAEGIGEGRLVPLLPRWSLPSVPVHAVFASARYLTPKVRAFIDLAAGSFRPAAGDAT